MLYSVIMVERLNENLQFYRDINFYQGSFCAFFIMNKHKKDDRFREVVAPNGEVIRREAVLYGTVDLVDSMFPIRYPLVLNDNKTLYNGPFCLHKKIIKTNTSGKIKYSPEKQKLQQSVIKGKRKTVYERDGWKCIICGELRVALLTMDHIIPKSRGGSYTNNNLQTMCRKCNSTKGNKMISNSTLKIIIFGNDKNKI